MNIAEQLGTEHSKKNALLICDYLGDNSERLKELMNCFFSTDQLISQRAAMVVSAKFDQQPALFGSYQLAMVQHLANEKLHIAVKRNTVRILQFMDLSEEAESQLLDHCLAYLKDEKEAIAVKAFSMGILANLCVSYPDLCHEVIQTIEETLAQNDTKGVQSRGRQVLKRLYQLQS